MLRLQIYEMTDDLGVNVKAIEADGIPQTFDICQKKIITKGGHVANVGVHGKIC